MPSSSRKDIIEKTTYWSLVSPLLVNKSMVELCSKPFLGTSPIAHQKRITFFPSESDRKRENLFPNENSKWLSNNSNEIITKAKQLIDFQLVSTWTQTTFEWQIQQITPFTRIGYWFFRGKMSKKNKIFVQFIRKAILKRFVPNGYLLISRSTNSIQLTKRLAIRQLSPFTVCHCSIGGKPPRTWNRINCSSNEIIIRVMNVVQSDRLF